MTLDAALERSMRPLSPETPYDRFRPAVGREMTDDVDQGGIRTWGAPERRSAYSGIFHASESDVNLMTL